MKELEEWQRVVVGTGTDQEAVVRMAATEYTKIAVQCWKDENAKLTAQLATLQAQLADRDAMILQMGEQAAVLAKENMAVKAQLRQVEGERDAADAELHRDMVEYCQFAHEIALPGTRLPEQVDDSISFGKLKDVVNAIVASRDTLRQLVEALPVVDGRMDVECGACYYIRSFVAGQYGVVCGLITEPSTAMAIKTLLEYRATQAAQDAGKGVSSG